MTGEAFRAIGIEEVARELDRIDRRATRDRQKLIRAAAAKALVPAVRSAASDAPGRAGPRLAAATNARLGKSGAVLVGPRTGKRTDHGKAFFRAMFIVGSRRHEIGGEVEGGTRLFTNRLGRVFARNHGGRTARHVRMPGTSSGWRTGPVQSPGLRSVPFVSSGVEAGQGAFIEAVSAAIFTEGS